MSLVIVAFIGREISEETWAVVAGGPRKAQVMKTGVNQSAAVLASHHVLTEGISPVVRELRGVVE